MKLQFRQKLVILHEVCFTAFIFVYLPCYYLVVISLERLHTTLFPFKHRFIKKWTYGVIITVIWLTTTSRESVQILLKEKGISTIYIESTLYLPSYLMLGFLICVCLYSNCCQSSMQSSSISPWCSQPERTKTDRYLGHCCTCVFIMLFASDDTCILSHSHLSWRRFPRPFLAAILHY